MHIQAFYIRGISLYCTECTLKRITVKMYSHVWLFVNHWHYLHKIHYVSKIKDLLLGAICAVHTSQGHFFYYFRLCLK